MAEVERCIFSAAFDGELPAEVGRVYLGAEFCCWLVPPARQLVSEIASVHHLGRPVSVVLPVLNEFFLPQLQTALSTLCPFLKDDDEIVISDWGALDPVRSCCPGVEVVAGRVLSGQKRGPQALSLDESSDTAGYFRRSRWHSEAMAAMLRDLGIFRVELDNPGQGVAPLPPGLRGTLHTPYAFVTSSRNCPWRTSGSTAACRGPCGEVFRLDAAPLEAPLLQRGNTQFVEKRGLPADPSSLGIDRVVFHPSLPR
ncbi:hypothetical protein [Geoalkalibacter subterraneus]|uniref:Uncharacterized protein n=1 Tax=Geoalkalibacter subterraneus TaxID=483547 RepID=A0A0B5FNF8_9BACT|nr:hypothetical protein [Geoalkalibacter subterraneus]AJF06159.1 hypothetical protein GSUB_05695 [Geoalkalibacter subterraneus]